MNCSKFSIINHLSFMGNADCILALDVHLTPMQPRKALAAAGRCGWNRGTEAALRELRTSTDALVKAGHARDSH